MHEQQLGRAVLGIIWRLLLTDCGKIPDMHTTVCAGGREVDGGVRGPRDLQDVVGVRLEGVELEIDLSDVPERDGLASAGSSDHHSDICGSRGRRNR